MQKNLCWRKIKKVNKRMAQKILKKDQIAKLYNELVGAYNFYAPINKKGNIAFEKIENPEDIVLDYLNSRIPPKSTVT